MEYEIPNEFQVTLGSFWPGGKAEGAACTAGSHQPVLVPGPAQPGFLPQPGALALVGHTPGWDPLPRLLTLLPGGEPVWDVLRLNALRNSSMSGKGSGPVSTFSFGDLPLLSFLICLGFFKIVIFLQAGTLISSLPVFRPCIKL